MYKHHLIMAAVLAAALQTAGIGAAAQGLDPIDPGFPPGGSDDPFAAIACPVIGYEEAWTLSGGDVFMTLNEQRTKITVYATDNRYVAGGKPDTLRQTYTVEAHNNVMETNKAPFYPTAKSEKEIKNRTDLLTIPEKFPTGTWNITEVSPRTNDYGPNMIKTDAVGRVEVVKLDAKKKEVVESYGKHEDQGYAIHSNTKPMSESKTYGCIIVSQEDNERIAATVKADQARGKSQKQTLTVIAQTKKRAMK